VWIPVRLSENGKRYRRFFETKEQAQKFIFETKRSGSVDVALANADVIMQKKTIARSIRPVISDSLGDARHPIRIARSRGLALDMGHV
jgi:hypothetical protein